MLSDLDLDDISKRLNSAGVMNYISNTPTHYLCNEAYWFSLQKYKGKVVFIYTPTVKNTSDGFQEKMNDVLE